MHVKRGKGIAIEAGKIRPPLTASSNADNPLLLSFRTPFPLEFGLRHGHNGPMRNIQYDPWVLQQFADDLYLRLWCLPTCALELSQVPLR